jgi:protein TonB
MLGVLLESKAVRQRRDGGAAMSVATHLAIVGFVAMATAKTPPQRDKEPTEIFRIPAPVIRQPTAPRHVAPSIPRTGGWTSAPVLPVITSIPPTLPPVELRVPPDATPSEVVFGDGRPGVRQLGAIDVGGGDGNAGGSADWSGTETMMRLVVSAKPRYPERLRVAGVNGRVRIRFVVDTTGRVELMSVQVIESTHELFTDAVREILPVLRFKPSEANGRRVRSLAEMPFEFQITR